jgi:hypothetical protein
MTKNSQILVRETARCDLRQGADGRGTPLSRWLFAAKVAILVITLAASQSGHAP